ncbi:MAG TPA: hypothetical protein VIK30_15600 [Polyangia bacterium]
MKLGKVISVGTLVVGIALGGCGGGSKPTTPQCSLNSDCAKLSTPGLVCALGYCVKPCNISSDCPNNERCVVVSRDADGGTSSGGADAGVAQGTACQAPELATCNYNSTCKSPLVCSNDHQCRDMCETSVDCPGMGIGAGAQVCTSITHLCADPILDKDYNAAINDFVVNDAGMGIPQGGNTGTGGNGTGTGGNGTGTGGTAGTAGGAGSNGTVTSCPTKPQTNFAYYAQGDSNLHFTSGVGVRTADQLLIFSGYSGPAPAGFDAGVASADGGVPSVNFVYVQAFDPVTGTMTGPAAPLFQAADGKTFGVFDVSIAPTGEIVLLHGSNQRGSAWEDTLYASFFSPTSPGAPVHLVRTVQIESAPLGNAHATWSVPSQGAFALSWKYQTSAWVSAVKKFRPNGSQAGGDTTVVPSPPGGQFDPTNTDDTHVGASGNFLGVASASPTFAYSYSYLTALDGNGNQVGGLLRLNDIGNTPTWVTIGGTATGFVTLFRYGNTGYEAFAKTSGDAGVLPPAAVDGGDAGPPPLPGFTFSTTSSHAHAINDDTGGANGVGVVLLDSDGANMVYVNADGVTHQLIAGVISSATGAEVAITNYHGSFGVSLYSTSATNHSTQLVASSCSQ